MPAFFNYEIFFTLHSNSFWEQFGNNLKVPKCLLNLGTLYSFFITLLPLTC